MFKTAIVVLAMFGIFVALNHWVPAANQILFRIGGFGITYITIAVLMVLYIGYKAKS